MKHLDRDFCIKTCLLQSFIFIEINILQEKFYLKAIHKNHTNGRFCVWKHRSKTYLKKCRGDVSPLAPLDPLMQEITSLKSLHKSNLLQISILGIRGGSRLCGAHGWNLERGPFYIYETAVDREKVSERTEVFVFLKQKKHEQKNESSPNMDVTIWTKLIDFKSSFLAGDLKPYW